jgi:hypothetical protein
MRVRKRIAFAAIARVRRDVEHALGEVRHRRQQIFLAHESRRSRLDVNDAHTRAYRTTAGNSGLSRRVKTSISSDASSFAVLAT